MNFQQTGQCNYGANCKFAHGEGELRPKPQFDQNRGGFSGGNRGRGGHAGGNRGTPGFCRNFQQTGNCNYGDNCKFIHQMSGPGGFPSGMQQGGYGGPPPNQNYQQYAPQGGFQPQSGFQPQGNFQPPQGSFQPPQGGFPPQQGGFQGDMGPAMQGYTGGAEGGPYG